MRDKVDIATVICLGPQGLPKTGQAIATETWIAHSVHEISALNNNFEGLGFLNRLLRSLLLPLRVYLMARSVKPSVMYLSIKRSTLGAIVDLACAIAFKLVMRGPIIVHLHGADLATVRQNSRVTNAIFHRLWRGVTDVIVLSPRMVEQLDGLPRRRVHVISNFSESFATVDGIANKVNHINCYSLRILYLSNIMFSKGFSYLIEAIHKLRSDGYSVKLKLAGKPIGDGYMSAGEALECLKTGLGEGIEYLGPVSGAGKWKLLEQAHIVALPTFYPTEAQPICLIEGMAFGCLPLTTRHNYNEDFLDPRTTLFVEMHSSMSIVKALRDVILNGTDAAERIRLVSAAARDKYDIEHYVDQVDCVIRKATQCAMSRSAELQEEKYFKWGVDSRQDSEK